MKKTLVILSEIFAQFWLIKELIQPLFMEHLLCWIIYAILRT